MAGEGQIPVSAISSSEEETLEVQVIWDKMAQNRFLRWCKKKYHSL